jgi:hypothetical protein
VAGQIERDLTAEQLRQRLSDLLRRYVPPASLPTAMPGESADVEPVRGTASARVTARDSSPEVNR